MKKDARKRGYRTRGPRRDQFTLLMARRKYKKVTPLSSRGRSMHDLPAQHKNGTVQVVGTAVVLLTHEDRLAYKVEVGVRGLYLKFAKPKDKYDNVPVYYVGYPFLKKFLSAHVNEKGVVRG